MPENLAKNSFSHVIFPGISVFCAPWENWAKLLALGKCKKKIQGNRQKSAKIPKFFSKKPFFSKFDGKCTLITLSNQPERLIFMIIVKSKENNWKLELFWEITIFAIYLQFFKIFGFLIIFGKKNENFLDDFWFVFFEKFKFVFKKSQKFALQVVISK